MVLGKEGMVDVPVGICSTSSRMLVYGETPAIEGGASNLVPVEETGCSWRFCGLDLEIRSEYCVTTPNMHAAQMMMPTKESFIRRTALARSAAESWTELGEGW